MERAQVNLQVTRRQLFGKATLGIGTAALAGLLPPDQAEQDRADEGH